MFIAVCFSLISIFTQLCISSQSHARAFPQTSPELLIRQQRYDDAFNSLEMILERKPDDVESLTLMGTATLYANLDDYEKALNWFEKAYQLGGDARFIVSAMRGRRKASPTDYPFEACRGWLKLRRREIAFEAFDDNHCSFQYEATSVSEFKVYAKKLVYLKIGKEFITFFPRSRDEREALLIVILWHRFVCR